MPARCPTRSAAGLDPIRSAPPGTGSASISRSSPPMPSGSSSACSIPPGRREIARCDAAGMHRRGLARLPAGRPRRACSTATARTGPTSRSRATASTRTSCCSTPMRSSSRARCAGPTRSTATASAFAARRPVLRPPRQRAGHAEGRRRRRQPSTGATTARRSVPWPDTVIYEAHVQGLTMLRARHPPARARHLRGARRSRASSTTCSGSASPRSSCCRSTPSCRTAAWSRRACATTGATTRLGFFAPEPRYLSDGIAERDEASPSAACTRPASRSSSTSSTTTPRRAARWGRPCRSAASTTLSYYRLHAGRPAALHQRHRHRQHA